MTHGRYTLTLEVVTPEREVVREPVAEVQVPGRKAIWASCRGTRRCSRDWASAR